MTPRATSSTSEGAAVVFVGTPRSLADAFSLLYAVGGAQTEDLRNPARLQKVIPLIAGVDNVEDEYIELLNVSGGVAPLFDPKATTNLAPFLDFPAAEWIDRPLSRLIHEQDRPQFEVAIRHCAPTEVRMTRSDGLWRVMDLSMTRRMSSDAGGIVATFRDITDRQRTKELEAAKETAEEASRLKSEFLTNVSHELFTPLNHVLGLTELTLASELDREQRTDLEAVVASGQKLLALLRNLTALSSLEAGETRLEASPFVLSGRPILIISGDPFKYDFSRRDSKDGHYHSVIQRSPNSARDCFDSRLRSRTGHPNLRY